MISKVTSTQYIQLSKASEPLQVLKGELYGAISVHANYNEFLHFLFQIRLNPFSIQKMFSTDKLKVNANHLVGKLRLIELVLHICFEH